MFEWLTNSINMAWNRSNDLFETSDEDAFVPNVLSIDADAVDPPQNNRQQNQTILISDDDLAFDLNIPDHNESSSSDDEEFTLNRRNQPNRYSNSVPIRTHSTPIRRRSFRQVSQQRIGRYGYELNSFVEESVLLTSDDFESSNSIIDLTSSSISEENTPGPIRNRNTRATFRSPPYTTRVRRYQVQNRSTVNSSNSNYRSLLGTNDIGNESDDNDANNGWLSARNNRNRPGPSRPSRRPTQGRNTIRRNINHNDEEIARQLQEQFDYELAVKLSNETQQPSPARLNELRELSSHRRVSNLNESIQPCSSRSLQINSPNDNRLQASREMHCIICFDDDLTEPMACIYCRNLVGCHGCIKKWFRTTNISRLNRNSPLSSGISNANHRACPLCRAEWDGKTPDVIPYKEVQ